MKPYAPSFVKTTKPKAPEMIKTTITEPLLDILKYAPIDIRRIILRKIPPKELFKNRLVSKTYRDVINNMNFKRLYFQLWKDELFIEFGDAVLLKFYTEAEFVDSVVELNASAFEAKKITDLTIGKLRNLKKLNMDWNKNISMKAVSQLENLEYLSAEGYQNISDEEDISNLKNLKYLNLNSSYIRNDSIENLVMLETLRACERTLISDQSIEKLINLKELDVGLNYNVTDESISKLLNLEILDADYNDEITDESVSKLSNLQYLNAEHNEEITEEGISDLPNLKKAVLYTEANETRTRPLCRFNQFKNKYVK